MSDALHDHIQRVTRNQDLSGYNEDQTKQAILLPILQILGWPIFDAGDVYPEYSAGRGRVDYALRVGNANKVFVEAKRCSVDLEAHQEQLLRYAFQHGVPLAVLTNGTLWWFYLPLREGAWEQRKFYSIDLLQREPTDVAQRLRDFLARDAVASGAAMSEAEKVLTSRQRRVEVERTLPKAWNGMLADPDDALVELVRDRVEQLCGFSPTDGEVQHYLRHAPEASRVRLSGVREPVTPTPDAIPAPTESAATSMETPRGEAESDAVPLADLLRRDMRKTKPTHLVIGTERIPVRGWSKLAVAFVEWLQGAGLLTLSSLPILSYSGKDRYYVHTSPAHRRESLGGKWSRVGPAYVDTNFSAKDHLKNLRSTLEQLGQEGLDVRIELRT